MLIEKPIILIAEDDEFAVQLMRTIFSRAGFEISIHYASDGAEAIAYLSGDGIYSDRRKYPLPTALLLDLKMPRKNGFEVLAWIRRQPSLNQLRVYVLSSSSQSEDIRRCYDLGASSYLVKPTNLDGLIHQTKCIIALLKLSHFTSEVDPKSETLAAGSVSHAN